MANIWANLCGTFAKDTQLQDLHLSNDFYVEWSSTKTCNSGRIFHIKRNEHGGSVSTGIARFFITAARVSPEGYHPHQRLDCFVSNPAIVPEPETLARLLFQSLKDCDLIAEPTWLSWHLASEEGGAAFGDVYDWD